jgi:beta-glucosidase
MVALGKPVVALVFNGRPISFAHLNETVPAILECWYLGQECGTAVAETLFGENNPSGKLPITIARSVGHLPAYYNYKPSARRGYLFDDVTPMYAFGFGRSYTTFEISNVRLRESTISTNDATVVLADVSNVGDRAGTEVVQMYIRDRVSSVTRPVKELKGFLRVALEPGETETVELWITHNSLAFYDIDMHWVVEPGDFDIMVGSSSRDEDLTTVTLHVTAAAPTSEWYRAPHTNPRAAHG